MDRRLTMINLHLSRFLISALRRHLQAWAELHKQDPGQVRREMDRFSPRFIGRRLTDREWAFFETYLGPDGDDRRREVSGKIIEYPLVTGTRIVSATTAAVDYNTAAVTELVRDLIDTSPTPQEHEAIVNFLSGLIETALSTPPEHHVH
ncbi:MAG: hypothetical protein KJ621_20080 [Proteobacteria bacterium]|nr:hypothetical protein [Pseudomonadota bacterium]